MTKEEPNENLSLDNDHQLLLGYPCKPGMKTAVLGLLRLYTTVQLRLVHDWAQFDLEDLPELAYDQVKNYKERDPYNCDPEARGAAINYLNDMHAWYLFIKGEGTIPLLENTDPADGVGEDIEHVVWTVAKGGKSDSLRSEQIDYLTGHLEKYKEYTLGNSRLLRRPNSIISQIPHQTKKDKLQRMQEQGRDAARGVLLFLYPPK